jgi:hypothetical protein
MGSIVGTDHGSRPTLALAHDVGARCSLALAMVGLANASGIVLRRPEALITSENGQPHLTISGILVP